MINGGKLYLTDKELDTTKTVIEELMVISDNKLAKVVLKSVIDIIDDIKGLGNKK